MRSLLTRNAKLILYEGPEYYMRDEGDILWGSRIGSIRLSYERLFSPFVFEYEQQVYFWLSCHTWRMGVLLLLLQHHVPDGTRQAAQGRWWQSNPSDFFEPGPAPGMSGQIFNACFPCIVQAMFSSHRFLVTCVYLVTTFFTLVLAFKVRDLWLGQHLHLQMQFFIQGAWHVQLAF
jgi:hypothetical protein